MYSRENGKKLLEFESNEFCTQASIYDNFVMGKKPHIVEKETVLIALCPNLNINSRILFIGLEGTLKAKQEKPTAKHFAHLKGRWFLTTHKIVKIDAVYLENLFWFGYKTKSNELMVMYRPTRVDFDLVPLFEEKIIDGVTTYDFHPSSLFKMENTVENNSEVTRVIRRTNSELPNLYSGPYF